jgi:hypothetical protein
MRMCEAGCRDIGALNSHYWKDDNGDGHWVCWACEELFIEENVNWCPCGCDSPENCVYKEQGNERKS